MILAGTKMIFPLPEVDIVTKDNYQAACAAATHSAKHVMKLLLG